MNALFICSRNKWRSRTAETIFKESREHSVKSAETGPTARIKVTADMIVWADIVFAMETRHKERLRERFPNETEGKQIVVLGIPDEYPYMDSELVEMIKSSVSVYLGNDIE